MLMLNQLVLILLALFSSVSGFEEGAPTSACLTRYPRHGVSAKITTSPYTITFNRTAYAPGDYIQVTVSNSNIKGIQMAVYRASNDSDDSDGSDEALGQFLNLPSKLKSFTCFGKLKDNMITHQHDHGVNSLTFIWRSPSENVGNVVFKTTIVRDYEEFWVDIRTVLNTTALPPFDAIMYPKIKFSGNLANIDFLPCGSRKGCFLYPSSCSGDDCIAAATFEYRAATDDYLVEITSNYDNQDYVALGLSHDRFMGDDETIVCVGSSSRLNVQHSYNDGYSNDRKLTISISDVEIKKADGRIQCRFVLPTVTDLYIIDQNAQSFMYTNTSFDHSKNWYLQLAWGQAMSPDSEVIAQHNVMPPVTFDKVNLKDKSIFRGSAYGYLVHAHVSLMLVGWLLFTGITTVVSRHYKHWLPERKILGTKVWFQLHRGLAVFVVLLTALGLVMVFVEYGAEIRQGSIPHSILGLIVAGFVAIQVIFGMLRPDPDHKRRIIFNWCHRVLGQLTHLIAAVTMFLGFGMDKNIQDMKTFGLIVIGVWLALQIIWHIIFEVMSRPGKPLNASDASGDADKSKKKKSSKLLTVFLFFYVLCLLALCAVAMTGFLIY